MAAFIFSNEGFYLALWGTFLMCVYTHGWLVCNIPCYFLSFTLSCMSKQKNQTVIFSSHKIPVLFLMLKVNSDLIFINPKVCIVRLRTFIPKSDSS